MLVETTLALLASRLATDKRFVDLDLLACAAKRAREGRFLHSFAETVCHEPSGFVGDIERAMQLVSRDAFLRGAQQVIGEKPFMERDMRALEYGSNRHREWLAAGLALVDALAGAVRRGLQLSRGFKCAAVRANRAIGPAQR